MKLFSILIFTFLLQTAYGQVILNADGPGNTYELITSVLAPNHNPIEVPDCSHLAFGRHIDELFDNELNTNVFRFYIHATPDNDRCINFDRQRNEIKTYDQSPDNLLGIENETVVYKWKFKLAAGFQSSPNFTHLHQLKSVGGSLAGMPMYTLTSRKGTPDRLELRYAETDNQVTLIQTDLSPFIDTWVEVSETIKYGLSGSYELEIKRVNDGHILLYYSNNSIINWRENADFVRPKWGIYRSLNNVQDLRDEEIRFADFSIEEKLSAIIETNTISKLTIFPNPIKNTLFIKNVLFRINRIRLIDLSGKEILNERIDSKESMTLDVTAIPNGIYMLNLNGEKRSRSELIVISH